MADIKRSYVAGFVRQLKEDKGHGNMSFRVLREKFILPIDSTFGKDILWSRRNREHVLVMFERGAKAHPTVTGVLTCPDLREIHAAAEGRAFQDVLNVRPRDQFVEIEEGADC